MLQHVIRNPQVGQEIDAAGFKPVLGQLAAKLHCGGYAKTTVRFYEQGAVHFAYWVAKRHVGRSQVNDSHITSFLARHLPRCHCPFGGVRQQHTVQAALRHFEAVLKAGNPWASDWGKKPAAFHFEVQRFDDYLRTTAGLQEATRAYRRRYVREFVQHFFGDGPLDTSRLSPKDRSEERRVGKETRD